MVARSGQVEGARGPRGPLWHALPADEVLSRFESSPAGLAEAEAARRLDRWGPNRLEVAPPVPAWRILAAQGRSLVVLLLLAAGLLALALGDTVEAASILLVLALNVGLGFSTELGARRAMEGLERLQVPSATVRRDGRDRTVAAAELVPGDVIVLEAGARVAADARLLSVAELRLVEAPLTGEPFPVVKGVEPAAENAPLPDRAPMVYASTLVADGRGVAVVTGTGAATELGAITELAGATEREKTPLERRLDALGRRLIWLTVGLATAVAATGWARGADLWLMVETGLALAIAAIPEGLPVVATITLAVGMHRMARRRALIRRLPAVETLGAATLVCTDKTGTLTAGEMTVVRILTAGREIEVTGVGYRPEGSFLVGGGALPADELPALRELLLTAALANRASLDASGGPRGDPTEAALLVAAAKAGLAREELLGGRPEVSEVPFTSERQLMATFHREQEGVVARVKGAPGRLLELSGAILEPDGRPRPLDADARREVLAANARLAGKGLRMLALARRRLREDETPGEDALSDLVFLGLAAISDPPAPGVAATVATLHAAGVRTVMLTGDQRPTAESIARELGILREAESVLEGHELAALEGERLAPRLATVGAISRVSPADKLRIVEAFQRRGEIVAMLGDGVNDAPALKRADIGVAMGVRGTDAARQAADVVLADDRFQTVAVAVEEGRVIFDNIRKFVFYLFSCNLAEVLVLLTGVAAGLPLPLLPLQILWLNLVTDVFPALALGLEPAEPDVMHRPPRPPQAEILSRGFLTQVAAYGLLLTAVTLAAFLWALHAGGLGIERARTVAFMTLAFGQLLHVFNARSPRAVLFTRRFLRNPWVWGALALTVALQLAVVYVPPLARLIQTRPLAPTDWIPILLAGAIPLLLGQAVKAVNRHGISLASWRTNR